MDANDANNINNILKSADNFIANLQVFAIFIY